jgi:hypothetical protein
MKDDIQYVISRIPIILVLGLLFFILGSLLGAKHSKASERSEVMALAKKNGYSPSQEVIQAIVKASRWYNIDPLELTAIGILETGLGKYSLVNKNKNSIDLGIFQINSANFSRCKMFNINTIEGNAMCAALILHNIRYNFSDKDEKWIGIYHSKKPKYKNKYFAKISKILYN